MKRFAIATAVLLGLTISCAPTATVQIPTPSPTTTTALTNTLLPTNTPLPTATATNTSAPTSTPTATATATLTNTPVPTSTTAPTATPTLAPRPAENESPRISITVDPGSRGGPNYREKSQLRVGADFHTVLDNEKGPLVIGEGGGSNIEVRRGQISIEVKQGGAHSFIVRNYRIENVDPSPTGGTRWLNALSVFNDSPQSGGKDYSLIYQVLVQPVGALNFAFRINVWNLYAGDTPANQFRPMPGSPSFALGQFVDFRVDLQEDGTIFLWQSDPGKNDWKLVTRGQIADDAKSKIYVEQFAYGLYCSCRQAKINVGRINLTFK